MDRDAAYSLSDCRKVDYQSVTDPRGNLGVIEQGRHLPFQPKRLYYITDVPAGAERGAHAHKRLHQFFFLPKGSVDLLLDDGRNTEEIRLTENFTGLYMCPMIWRDLRNFAPGTVVGVLASEAYDEDDYIRSYEDFRRIAGA